MAFFLVSGIAMLLAGIFFTALTIRSKDPNNLILTTGELSNKIGYKNYKMKNQTIANAVNYTYTYKANGKSYHLRGVKLTHSRHLRKRVEIVYLRGFPRCAYEGHFSGIMESLLAISLTAMGMLLLAIYLFVA